ncbi:VacJ family lipoprotein [Roseibacterium beibuensis]|uniref:MlaA family lipoprotein n=1 Tax=[Roseibacterium] beibuensis TaxID=1193142 RepID=UPI00217D1F3C|nr:VacJ family lipoprotein [Roseibacterium beibuensis]MCS6626601.1 VacJ family lipoprotein [Roseibacterium beibuensis]
MTDRRSSDRAAWRGHLARAVGAITLAALAACGPATLPPGDQVPDASEEQNRSVHRLNVALDRALVGPASDGFGDAIPQPVRRGVSNFASNLSQPGYVLNNLLQLRLEDAARNTLRFAVNSTIGLGGLLDPASDMGLDAEETDFGETMHVYGFPEGDYVVLPVLGPSTTRDTVGMVVDFALNPLRHVAQPPESHYITAARIAGRLNTRHEFAGSVEGVLYDSEDSYLQMRSLYLQNRRYELRGDTADGYFDPYIDPYAEGDAADDAVAAADPMTDPYYDPYSDPYFDPYAQ